MQQISLINRKYAYLFNFTYMGVKCMALSFCKMIKAPPPQHIGFKVTDKQSYPKQLQQNHLLTTVTTLVLMVYVTQVSSVIIALQ